MEQKPDIAQLRLQLISANQEYVNQLREGKSLQDLQDLNKIINGLIAMIQWEEKKRSSETSG